MIFENARVPHANVIGEPAGDTQHDKGERTGGDLFVISSSPPTRSAFAGRVRGVDAARQDAHAGRQTLFSQQRIQLKLGRMHMLTEALRSYVMRVAWEHDRRALPNAGLLVNYSTTSSRKSRASISIVHGSAGA